MRQCILLYFFNDYRFSELDYDYHGRELSQVGIVMEQPAMILQLSSQEAG